MKWYGWVIVGACFLLLFMWNITESNERVEQVTKLEAEMNELKAQNEDTLKAAQIYEDINNHILNGEW